ncbi:MAG: bifunctional folylpolyglutamate synthase/dihydrofolate synthase, partial [Clostridia bacterium]|nr:bifunctional folylpolyglutamate synthase/dihydrofolate synthase [Clostridia bacterium]
MNYEETINYIHSIPKFRRPLGNENLARLLGLLGNPQKKLRFVHIAGTNGKGSAAAMTAEILKRAGYKTGLFTSPFIEVFNERICVCGKNIPDNLLIEYTERVKNIMETSGALVSEFAFVTAVAFLYFYEQKCDFVVLEVGMGGSLDATNVIDNSVVSVIMKIALDHTQYLGDTIEEITVEKCGIIKQGGTVIAYPNEKKTLDIIRAYAQEKHAELKIADVRKAEGYELSLKGAYQPYNAAVVLEI